MSSQLNKNEAGEVDVHRLPRHIAIIMDGNGRWAQARNLPRTAGHKAGAENFRKIATYCKNLGIEYLTVYAFSTENWKRPNDEISTIMGLLKKYLLESIETMARDHIKLRFLGNLDPLSEDLKELIDKTNDISSQITGFQANVCLNYGGRDDIVHAARRFAEEVKAGNQEPKNLSESLFSQYLYSAELPDPELVIRTSGEERISNFLLWQSAYSEYYFTDVYWPEFDEKQLDQALIAFQKRKRRFGDIK